MGTFTSLLFKPKLCIFSILSSKPKVCRVSSLFVKDNSMQIQISSSAEAKNCISDFPVFQSYLVPVQNSKSLESFPSAIRTQRLCANVPVSNQDESVQIFPAFFNHDQGVHLFQTLGSFLSESFFFQIFDIFFAQFFNLPYFPVFFPPNIGMLI